MRNLLLASLLVSSLATAGTALAQNAGPAGIAPASAAPAVHGARHAGRHGGDNLMQRHERILAKLDLTPDQKAKIDAHDADSQIRRKEIAKRFKGDPTEKKAQGRLVRKANKEFMKEVLSPTQFAEYRTMRAAAAKTRKKL